MIIQLVRQYINSELPHIEHLSSTLTSLTHDRLTHEQFHLSTINASLKPAVERIITSTKLLLKRGYSITTVNGKVIREPSMLKHGDEIETLLNKGTVRSLVK